MRGEPQRLGKLQLIAAPRSLSSIYEVSAFASACIAVASLAVAEWLDGTDHVGLDARHAAPGVSERTLACADRLGAAAGLGPAGWRLPDPRWVREAPHQLRLSPGCARRRGPPSREAIARVLERSTSEAAEQAVVAAGGCAAALRSESDWAGHAAGAAVLSEPLIGWTQHAASVRSCHAQPSATRPLAGLRALDLTRVIAGPVATRFLAGYGADVLRVDPPGFAGGPRAGRRGDARQALHRARPA